MREIRAIRVLPETLAVDDGDTTRLVATLFDQTGAVFAPPPASARLAWGSSAPAVASVDSSGLVSGQRPGAAQVTASVLGAEVPLSLSTQVVVRAVPTALAPLAGDSQTAAVGTRLPQDLRVRVTDRHGNGVPGIAVGFALTAGRGVLTRDNAVTDTAGQASAGLTLDTVPGAVGVFATAARLPSALVRFRAQGRPGAVTKLLVVSGDAQGALTGAPLPAPLVVRASDRYNNAVPGVTVSWQVTAGGGSVLPASSVTDSLGQAQTVWTMGAAPGPQSVRAAAGGALVAGFAASARSRVTSVTVAPAPASVALDSTRSFTATPRDSAGTALAGRPVTWTSSDTLKATIDGAGVLTARGLGAVTVTATVEGVSGSAAVTVTPGVISPALSVVSVSRDTVASGAVVTLALHGRDGHGNPVVIGGHVVAFTASGGTSTGTIGATADSGNGVYVASFTGVHAGTATTIGATIDGYGVATSLPTVVVVPGAATQLTFTTQPAGGAAGVGFGAVVTAFDAQANAATAFAGTVAVALTSGTGAAGAHVLGTTSVAAVGGIATFAGLSIDSAAAGYTLTASAAGLTNATSAPFTVGAGAVSLSRSVVTAARLTVASGDTATVVLRARDGFGNALTSGGLSVAFAASGGTSTVTFGPVSDRGDGTYAALLTGAAAGTPATIGATIGGASVSSALPTLTVVPGTASPGQSVVTVARATVASGDTVSVALRARDAHGNALTSGGLTVAFSTGGGASTATFGATTDHGDGTYTAILTGSAAGAATTVHATINSAAVTGTLPSVTVTPGPASAAQSTVSVARPTVALGDTVTLSLRARDAAGNALATGGLAVVFSTSGGTSQGTIGPTTDQGNGSYSALFTGTAGGSSLTVGATINGVPVTSALPTIQVVAAALVSVSLAAGANHACEIRAGGVVWCWGANGSGQIGDGTTINRPSPNAVAGGFAFAAVSAGGDHTCALTAAGAAYCWGGNAAGQLGTGGTASSASPVAVAGGLSFVQILAGGGFTCGLSTAGEAYCWGSNGDGKLGVGSATSSSPVPLLVAGGRTYTRLGLWGNNHACGIATGGAAYCWGYNFDGELGDGTQTSRDVPTAVIGGLTFRDIVGSTYHTCTLIAGGAAYCWGDNNVAQLGYGTGDSYAPGAVQGGYSFSSLTAGDNHTCGLLADGSAVCWGYGVEGALGDSANAVRLAPAPVVGGLHFTALAAGDNFTCGHTTAGATWCWGRNASGQLGNPSGAASNVPIPLGQVAVASVALAVPRDTVASGDTVRLAATLRDGLGSLLTGRAVAWASSDTSLAVVDAAGLVLAKRRGRPSVSATSEGVTAAAILTVVPGAARRLAFTTQPTNVQVGQTMPLVAASVLDSVGNVVDTYAVPVVATIGTNPGGATLGGTITTVPSSGVASFADLTVSAAGTGYTLIVSSTGLVSAVSHAFTVTSVPLPPIALDVPGPDVIAPGRSNLLNLVLPLPAPVGGVTVTVTSDAPGVANPASASVVFAAGATTGQVVVNGLSVGSTTLHATGAGYGAGALPVSVTAGINTVRADTLSVGTKSACQIRSGQLYCWGNNALGQLGDGTTVDHGFPTKAALGYTFVAVSVGSTHACGLTATGTAYCWGDNAFGALGAYCYNFCGSQSSTPIAVDGGVLFAKIRAGYQSTCGLTVDGAIYCWGYGGGGQLGVASGGAPGPISSTLTFDDVAVGGFAGYGFSCGLTTGGAAYCWGDARFGQLGDSTTTSRYLPAPVVAGPAFTQLSAGFEGIPGHSCALTATGDTYCWGGGQYGALGFTAGSGYLPYPGLVTGAPALSSVTAGGDLTCGLDAVGAAWCWGKNVNGALGDGGTTSRATAGPVSGGHTFSTLRAGTNSVCGFATSGELWCWGSNGNGQIGDGTTTDRDAPVLVTIPQPVASVTIAPPAPSIVVGAAVQLAATLRDAGSNVLSGRAVTWVSADTTIAVVDSAAGLVHGRAAGTVTVTATAEGVSGTATVTVTPAVPVLGIGSVSASYSSTCDVRPDLTLTCWGNNGSGQLGNGNTTTQTLPAPVASSVPFMQVATGSAHTCALAADSTAYCWGHGFYGALGNGGTADSPTPTPVSSTLHFAQIVSGYENSCARTAAGDVWCWGHDGGGDRLLPVQLNLPPLAFISERFYFVCGLTAAGQAFCWGNNGNGNLGNGTSGGWVAADPADTVIGNLRFTSIAAGSAHACGIATTGTVYCWGDNSSYQLGTNGPQYVVNATPAHISGSGSFTSVYAGINHSCVLAADGTARCWGTGTYGQLGDGDRVDISGGPGAFVTGGLKFSVLTLGNQYSCGRTLDGNTYCWGAGGGQLGLGNTATWYDPQLVH